MIIANGKQFDNYQHLEEWCIDNGFHITIFQQVNVHYALAQVQQLNEMDAEVRRAPRRERESQEQEFAVDRKYHGR